MPRNTITKEDLLVKIYSLKTKLYEDDYPLKSNEWKEGAQFALNEVIDTLSQYRS
jgi:hypothetical protein